MTDQPTYAEPRPRDFSARLTRRARPIGARRKRHHAGRHLAVLAVAVAVPAMAQGDFGPGGGSPQTLEARAPMGFETPGESFPGSAFYYLDDLPNLYPGTAVPRPADDPKFPLPDPSAGRLDSGPVAPALRFAGSATDRARAQHCLTLAIYYEAASEADAGQRAVAQVVLNRVAHPTYPSTVCGVVFQGSERTTGCQFSFTCDGSMARKPARMWWDRAAQVARAALSGAVYAPVGLATHYHTVQIHPYWADSLHHVGTIGAHRFYRWRGAAGRPAAFRAAYLGGEPAAAPHPRAAIATSAASSEADPVALARAYEETLDQPRSVAALQVRTPAPVYAAAVEARGGDALYRADTMPGAGQVREEYARSGQWLKQP
jgi:hypothetical protein